MRVKELGDFKKNFDDIGISKFWSTSSKKFSRRHNIHVYPAKFPPFLVDRAIEFASKKEIQIAKIADIFCGCGTTALESVLNEKDFWGIDRNPVATLITKVKTSSYRKNLLEKYFDKILKSYNKRTRKDAPKRILNNERLRFWYREQELADLNALHNRINRLVPEGKYRDFFLCSFSNILKKTSLWLQKSIKPTKDYSKEPHDVIKAFSFQYRQMLKAVVEVDLTDSEGEASIKTGNFISYKGKSPQADLLITSPPYVTSYEYADLHQLSSIWLNYADDYRDLRKGSIGSTFGIGKDFSDKLNPIGKEIVEQLRISKNNGQAKSAAKYFHDMSQVLSKMNDVLRPGGMGVIVIGNTEYSGVKIDNAKFIAYELFHCGMESIKVYKREIGTKILTRHRDKEGKFTNKKKSKNIYHCEFLITFQTP